jgi:hypothetical protein
MANRNSERQMNRSGYQGNSQYDQEGERGQQARNEWQRSGERSRYDQESGWRDQSDPQFGRQPGMGTGSYYGEQSEQPGTRRGYGSGSQQWDTGDSYDYGQPSRRQGSSGAYGPRGQQSGQYGPGSRGYDGDYNRQDYGASYGQQGGSYGYGGERQEDYDSGRGYGDWDEQSGSSYGQQPGYGSGSGQQRSYGGGYGQERGYGEGFGQQRGFTGGYGRQGGGYGRSGQGYRPGGGAMDWDGGRGQDWSERDYGYMSEGRRDFDRGEQRQWGQWRPRSYQGSGFGVMGGYDRPRGYGELGEAAEGPYTGRGPRGYKRSDDRICEEVCERLMHLGQVDATGIDVNVEQGEVTLKGTVRDRWQKRMAEDAAEMVWGVKDVNNKLKTEGNSGGSRWSGDDDHDRKSAADAFTTPGTTHTGSGDQEGIASGHSANVG